MNYLVDTHLLLWGAPNPARLSPMAAEILNDEKFLLWFSAASIWEVAIKRSLDKPDFRIDAAPLRAGLLRNDYAEVAIESRHTLELAAMPYYHADPIDRLLVAQAMSEGMVLLTADRALAAYGPHVKVV